MDYRKYRCNLWERLGCLAAGTAVAAAIAWLFYRSWYGMVLVIPVNYLIVSYYKNKKRDERAKKLMIEFRDAIQAVAAALLAGYSIEHAWKEAEREIMDLYGKEAMITKELIQMNAEIKLNRNVEEILHDLAVRSGVEEIQSFAEIFGFAKRSGTSAKFSITFDLAWKVMKDILVEYYAMTGFIAGSLREVLKTSYKAELISDDTWIEMLKGGRLKPFYHISIPVDQKLRKVPLDIRGVTEIRLGAV